MGGLGTDRLSILPMRWLASRRWRIFFVGWIVFTAHFATNVVREHYPAFTLAERGSLQVDEYLGFHADIFRHTDGHSYVGNNVAVSFLAAAPLFVFDPLLDRLEAYRKNQLEGGGYEPWTRYDTEKPNRKAFFALVKERGLDLRFGAATVVTSAFLMAPFSALSMVLMYSVLRLRRVGRSHATWLALLYGFGTPILFRTASLNHNLFMMHAFFLAFLLLWSPDRRGDVAKEGLPTARRAAAGFFAAATFAIDYLGVFTLGLLFLYWLLPRLRSAGWGPAARESLPFVAGGIPPVLFLWATQWSMYGHPFLPGQAWMPNQNAYVVEGWRGITFPTLDLFFLNLFDPWYGLFVFGPVLLFGFLPVPAGGRVAAGGGSAWILPSRERVFLWATFLMVLTFCAANQYSRLQYNSGVRYLIPLVPLAFLAAADVLLRLPRWAQGVTTVAVVAHSWVLTVFREPVFLSWRLFFEEGVQLPWLRVLRMTSPPGSLVHDAWWLGATLLTLTVGACLLIWGLGARWERGEGAA